MDFQHRPGGKTGSGGVASSSESNRDRRERLRQLALETIDINKDPYFMKNHLGSYECKLCLTLHNNEGSYLAHTQGKKHQTNLARRAAKEAKESPAQPAPEKVKVEVKKFVKIGRPGYKVTKQRDAEVGQQSLLFQIDYPEIAEGVIPRHRFMSAYEQRIEPPDRRWQYLLFAAEPYETISFKVPSREIDKVEGKFWTHWNRETKQFFLQFHFKMEKPLQPPTLPIGPPGIKNRPPPPPLMNGLPARAPMPPDALPPPRPAGMPMPPMPPAGPVPPGPPQLPPAPQGPPPTPQGPPPTPQGPPPTPQGLPPAPQGPPPAPQGPPPTPQGLPPAPQGPPPTPQGLPPPPTPQGLPPPPTPQGLPPPPTPQGLPPPPPTPQGLPPPPTPQGLPPPAPQGLPPPLYAIAGIFIYHVVCFHIVNLTSRLFEERINLKTTFKLRSQRMPLSDQYLKLEEERRQQQKQDRQKKKKKQKKDKGKRRHDSLHTESDEDITPVHHVDIITEEMPENALPSDDDDKDPNDPYKALDIDLDKPLTDNEKLPVRTHRVTEKKAPEVEAASVEDKSKKPKKAKKEKDKKKDKEKKKSKEKVSKKHKSSENAEHEHDTPKEEIIAPTSQEEENEKPTGEASDLDFWLSPAPVQSKPQQELLRNEVASELQETLKENDKKEDAKSSKHKKKKHKEKSKEEKKSKKKKHHSEEEAPESVQNGSLEDEPLPPMSNYCLLAEDSYVKMMYDVQGNLQDGSQVVVSVIFENQSSGYLKSMEFNVLDSLNTKLVRPEGSSIHDGISVPFQLPPEVSNEARFVFTVESIVMPQKLKGTLTFIVKTDDGSSHEKLDFKLHFTCTSYMITTPCYSDAFAKLLESGELKMCSMKVDGINISFQLLLAKICFHHHFSVVEQINSCASMYSRSIQGHHMCLLVKLGDSSVSVDGKCSDSSLLGNLLDELKQTLTEKC
ncbi:splicing factor 3A subunit 2 [Rhincodon typus]|uniref:splicing factor 3A subunit 2 n=1 Tax=Rhincodon typus TaxID=259920 RepID=UPI00202E1B7D|nr:splicing factor 3A subunit 2 [Rhincodon typus]